MTREDSQATSDHDSATEDSVDGAANETRPDALRAEVSAIDETRVHCVIELDEDDYARKVQQHGFSRHYPSVYDGYEPQLGIYKGD